MAYQISDACVSCGACESQCPVGAISMGDGKFEIDADKCIDCGSCAGACPTGSSKTQRINFINTIEQGKVYLPLFARLSAFADIFMYHPMLVHFLLNFGLHSLSEEMELLLSLRFSLLL